MLKKLTLNNFRNHIFLQFADFKQLVIIKGDNAVGKTNIIEAIQLITMIESFKRPQWHAVCYQNKKEEGQEDLITTIKVMANINSRELDIQMDIKDGKRNYYFQSNKYNPNDLKGLIPAVLFTPDDLTLIKGSSGAKRDQIDVLGTQLSKNYANLLQEYSKILKQRNQILKEAPLNIALLEAWDEHFIMLGTKVYIHRKKLFYQTLEAAISIYKELAGETLSGEYLSTWYVDNLVSTKEITTHFKKKLLEVREQEIAAGHTKIGPHRDELKYFINGKEARVFASQGQQRTMVLALKLAERKLILEIKKTEPIILLDDVMSELDEKRRQALLKLLSNSTQTFITTTNLGYFNKKILDNAQIIELKNDISSTR